MNEKPTYDELLAENTWLHKNALKTRQALLDELASELLADDTPLIRVKAEAYEYRIYELELAFMFQTPGTPESDEARESMERVTANYHRDHPGRPLAPKPRPVEHPAPYVSKYPATPPYKERKPYTRKAKAA